MERGFFFILTWGHNFFKLLLKREKEKQTKGDWVPFCMHPDWGLNPPPGYVALTLNQLATFWSADLHPNQLSCTSQGKSYCLVNKCASCHPDIMAQREDSGQMGLARFFPVSHTEVKLK